MLTMLLSANKHWVCTARTSECEVKQLAIMTICMVDALPCEGAVMNTKDDLFVQNVKGVCLNPKRNQRLHPGTRLIQTICHPLRLTSVPVSEGVKALNVRFQFDSRLPDDGWPNPEHMATHFCFEIVCFLYKLLLLLLLLWRHCITECCDSICVLFKGDCRAMGGLHLFYLTCGAFGVDPSRLPLFATVM